jgi:hypothetical protein
VIKSKSIRWAGYVAGMGERLGAYRSFVGELRERDHLEILGVEGREIFKIYFEELGWRHGLEWSGSGEGKIGNL